jgi:hypothetical protein
MQGVSSQRRQQSYGQGDKAETALAQLLARRGSVVQQHPRNTRRNYEDKVDLDIVTRSGQHFAIEVKSEKRNTEGLILLEVVGSKGYPGWLCGKADYVAQEHGNEWLFYRREEALLYLVSKYGDYKGITVERFSSSMVKPMRQWIGRQGRNDYGTVQKDVFMLIPFSEFESRIVSLRMKKD